MKTKSNILAIIIIIIIGTSVYIANEYYQDYLDEQSNTIILKDAKLEDISQESKKINIYVFWGSGCPHCEELFRFLESIRSNYGKYYNVYGFEVWDNEENGKIMDSFKEEFKEETGKRSVPYFIIGDEPFIGYPSSMNREIKETIRTKYKNRKEINKFENILENKEEINK